MTWPSALAIYLLFWVLSAFVVMPFHTKTSEEAGEALVPGQAESAPHKFQASRIALWTTILATASFALYYANYVYGWLSPDLFDPFSR